MKRWTDTLRVRETHVTQDSLDILSAAGEALSVELYVLVRDARVLEVGPDDPVAGWVEPELWSGLLATGYSYQ